MSSEREKPWRVQAPVYGAGLFSNSMSDLAAIALPLYLATLGLGPVAIGFIVGARHALPFVLAIHGGALMDRLGAHRLMTVSAGVGALVLAGFPLSHQVGTIVGLQVVNGLCTSMSWIGAQTCFGLLLHGNPVYSGRFSFALRLGSFAGPPLVGLGWDWLGPWGAFSVMIVWALGTLLSSLVMETPEGAAPEASRRFRMRDLLPRISDYAAAFRLATIPGMTIVLMVTVLRIAASGVQDSFYTVYLQSVDVSATRIGLLVTASAAIAAFSSLTVGFFTRFTTPVWLLILTTFGSIVFVCVTPLMNSFPLLLAAAALRGFCMGLSQPLMLSILVDAAGRSSQGKGVALRTTANRAASALTPAVMGSIAGATGLEASFLIMGGLLGLATLVVAAYVWRRPDLADA